MPAALDDGTIVGFEVGLNTAVSHLRQALNDPVVFSRLIETIPKRGYRSIASITKQPSLPVMSLVLNQTPGQEGDYFSDAPTEELIPACWRIEGIRVAGHTTVTRFRNQTYDPMRAAKELGVDSVLEGSVRRMAGRIRINVNLIDGQDGF